MKNPIVIFGAGGHAKVVIDIIRSNLRYQVAGIVDNSLPIGCEFYGVKVIANDKNIKTLIELDQITKGVIAVGDNAIRKRIVNTIMTTKPDFQFISAIAKSTVISNSVTIGCGTVIMPGSIINADTRIGKHCIVNTKASIDHDCVIENFVSLSPNVTLAGSVHVAEGAFLGTSATVIPGKTIGANTVIGAGAVVIHDIESSQKAIGIPAKVI